MPLGPNVKYRWKTYPSGKKIRLAFQGNTVVEVKKKGGQAHDLRSMANSRMKKGN